MRNLETGTDLFDPRTGMESEFTRGSVSASTDADFAFAFNDSNFSDRQLRIEIMGDPLENRADNEGCTSICNSIADWARHRKRRREDIKKDTGNSFFFFFLLFIFSEFFCLVAEKVLRKLGKNCISEFRLKFKLVL